MRGSLQPIQHKIVVALITQDVHGRDIVDSMVQENITSPSEFYWQQ